MLNFNTHCMSSIKCLLAKFENQTSWKIKQCWENCEKFRRFRISVIYSPYSPFSMDADALFRHLTLNICAKKKQNNVKTFFFKFWEKCQIQSLCKSFTRIHFFKLHYVVFDWTFLRLNILRPPVNVKQMKCSVICMEY